MRQDMSVLVSSESNEWYTPPEYVDLARHVMGGVDLDPASSEEANHLVRASRYLTIQDDGLSVDWNGRVWLNPPYGKYGQKPAQGVWADRLEMEFCMGRVQQAVLLTKTVPGYQWWEVLFRRWPVCMARERIWFIPAGGGDAGQAKAGSSFWYLGPLVDKFQEVFSQIGRVILP